MPDHWILMNGSSGCLPDSCDAYQEKVRAIQSAQARFDNLSERQVKAMSRDLRQYGYHSFAQPRKAGADYIEVVSCDCAEPWEHSETDSAENWEEYLG